MCNVPLVLLHMHCLVFTNRPMIIGLPYIYTITQILIGVQDAQQRLQSLEIFSMVEVLLDTAKGTCTTTMCIC